jgi:hypothetical protein
MKKKLPPDLQAWIDARQRFRLSHAQVQMARELGLNPKKLGGLANHRQEPWKAPLPEFIERLYRERFGKDAPDRVLSIEERFRETQAKKAARRARKKDASAEPSAGPGGPSEDQPLGPFDPAEGGPRLDGELPF